MDKLKPCHILVVRYGTDPVTFLNQLLIGLADEDFDITIAADRKSLNKYFINDNIDVLWAPSGKAPF